MRKIAAIVISGAAMLTLVAADQPDRPVFQADGTVLVPAFVLPPSSLSSPEAREQQRARAGRPVAVATFQEPDIAVRRAQIDGMMGGRIGMMLQAYPATMEESAISGIPVRIFTPKGKAPVKNRVLINLHGGGFTACWDACSKLESIPLSGLGGYKVVSVNYRMAPEAKHPAGVEDVATVYRALLKSYRPSQIGIYGCSAGGSLTAQAAAWLPANGLPQAGAIGIFGAGGARFESGDSVYVASAIDGSFGPAPKPGEKPVDITRGYFDGADQDGPILAPAKHPDVLKRFPPTLLITGTRAIDMSPAIFTNSRLLAAGVKSTLIVGEAMGHCYIYDPRTPETRDALAAAVAFFRSNLR
jgi:epsilon-lactone hydrolase